mmetsp:Transcript_15322/g.39454  ORF Transcript_15322/g.39454 Transcript_15322/m.39454 type:complete len:200 (-) Transcript_15322:45-644(-)
MVPQQRAEPPQAIQRTAAASGDGANAARKPTPAMAMPRMDAGKLTMKARLVGRERRMACSRTASPALECSKGLASKMASLSSTAYALASRMMAAARPPSGAQNLAPCSAMGKRKEQTMIIMCSPCARAVWTGAAGVSAAPAESRDSCKWARHSMSLYQQARDDALATAAFHCYHPMRCAGPKIFTMEFKIPCYIPAGET